MLLTHLKKNTSYFPTDSSSFLNYDHGNFSIIQSQITYLKNYLPVQDGKKMPTNMTKLV